LGLLAVLVLASSYAISLTTVYLLHYLRRTAAVMARKKATPDELEAGAEANGYQRGGTGKKTAVETAISTWTRPRKIKMQRWATMWCKGALFIL
jgi:hypothetical protein